MDWSLRACGRHGHATYAPDEEALKARLKATTPAGEAWRCLRCGDFVIGEPMGRGPARDAPVVLRGRELRDAVVLRLLATERLVRAVFLLIIAYGTYRFRNGQTSVARTFDQVLPLARPLAARFGYNLEQSAAVRLIKDALSARTSTLTWVAVGLAVYGLLQVAEGTGLWLLKRWGEYLAVVATGAFIPVEIYELIHKPTLFKGGAFVINVAAVVYLLLTKRLFGLRGGYAAFEAERHEESLLEVETSAGDHAAPVDPGAAVASGQDRPQHG